MSRALLNPLYNTLRHVPYFSLVVTLLGSALKLSQSMPDCRMMFATCLIVADSKIVRSCGRPRDRGTKKIIAASSLQQRHSCSERQPKCRAIVYMPSMAVAFLELSKCELMKDGQQLSVEAAELRSAHWFHTSPELFLAKPPQAVCRPRCAERCDLLVDSGGTRKH